MSIQEKLDKIQNLIGEICEDIANEEQADETAARKLNELTDHLDLTYDNIYDLEKAYDEYQDYLEIADEPPRDSWDYNGVSPRDFYEA